MVANCGTIYYRFHGTPNLYSSAYAEMALQAFVQEVQANDGIREAWCYFNNDAAVAAIPDAHTLIRLANSE